jgi:hypothetical protein
MPAAVFEKALTERLDRVFVPVVTKESYRLKASLGVLAAHVRQNAQNL